MENTHAQISILIEKLNEALINSKELAKTEKRFKRINTRVNSLLKAVQKLDTNQEDTTMKHQNPQFDREEDQKDNQDNQENQENLDNLLAENNKKDEKDDEADKENQKGNEDGQEVDPESAA